MAKKQNPRPENGKPEPNRVHRKSLRAFDFLTGYMTHAPVYEKLLFRKLIILIKAVTAEDGTVDCESLDYFYRKTLGVPVAKPAPPNTWE